MNAQHSRRTYLRLLGATSTAGLAGCSLSSIREQLSEPGSEFWSYQSEIDGQLFPAVGDERVYVSSTAGTLAAVSAQNGEEDWLVELDGAIQAPPVAFDGVVYTGTTNGTLYAIDGATGQQEWETTSETPIYTQPTLGSDRLYLGTDNVVGVNCTNGSRTTILETPAPIDSRVAVLGNLLFAGSRSGSFYALDLTNGNVQWIYELDSDALVSPTVDDGAAYIGPMSGNLTAIDTQTGTEEWTFEMELAEFPPMSIDGYVYAVSESGSVTKLASGAEDLWSFEPTTEVSAPLAEMITRGRLFVATSDNRLIELDMESGEQQWTVTTDGAILSKPVAENDFVYIGTDSGQLHAIVAE